MGRNPECLGRQPGYGLAPTGTVSSSNLNVHADVISWGSSRLVSAAPGSLCRGVSMATGVSRQHDIASYNAGWGGGGGGRSGGWGEGGGVSRP